MTDQNISRSPEYLQERVSYLEESNRRFMSILDIHNAMIWIFWKC